MATRRQFIQYIPVAAAAVLAACSKKEPEAPVAAPEAPAAAAPEAPAAAAPAAEAAPAAAAEAVLETDANAVQLGYVLDATKADKAKFPQYKEGSICGNCALYAAAADAPQGPCGLFGGKLVANGGWCSAYAPKPA